MTTNEFITSLRQELIQTQNIRFKFAIQKLIFIIGLLGIGSIPLEGKLIDFKFLIYFVPFVTFMFDLYIIGENFGIRRIGIFLKFAKENSAEERFWEFLLNIPKNKSRDLFAIHGNIYSTFVAIVLSFFLLFFKIDLESNLLIPNFTTINIIWIFLVIIFCIISWGVYPKIQYNRLITFMESITKYNTSWIDIIKNEKTILLKNEELKITKEKIEKLFRNKNKRAHKVHISVRGRCVNQWRILASQFSPGGHERSPKSASQYAPTDERHF